jgi:Mn2+/Fe2+ NRAMP family transporter
MGKYTNGVVFNAIAWATVIIMGLLTVISTIQSVIPGAGS